MEDGKYGIRNIHIPPGAAGILRVLEDHGHEAFVVGGCVRDSLLGREPHDWDITTSARPEEVKALFRRTIDTGLKHGTVTILAGGEAYEVTTYRVDGEYLDGRHPSDVTFTSSLREDLLRRDFTINAMAYSDSAGLQDCFGGLEDLERGRIRAVGDPVKRFEEDALRIMRAVRFAAQLGYEVEENTVAAMKALAPTLAKISAERIAAELEKLLVSPHPEKLLMAYECGITAVVLPEFDRCMETPQNNPHHQYNVGVHTVRSIMQARPDRVLRLAILMHDFGKPQCRTTDENGVDHFYGHPEVSAGLADSAARRLKLDNETRRRVVRLVKFHDNAPRLTKPGVRKAVILIGEDLFPLYLEVKEADTLAQSLYRRQEKLDFLAKVRRLYEEILRDRDCLSLRDLAVKGDDLMAAGVPEGKEVGRILRKMLQDVLDEPAHNNRDYLLRKYV
ncbi:MAG: CCA tRNA nucleotidyltransferase [Eubacteriales bacterium]|nr:CCA tRNA nucleotidyltransferase [Eubacteriales bacterium]